MSRASYLPKVSVVIPCNDDTYLMSALRSVVAQTYPSHLIELVFVESAFNILPEYQDFIMAHFPIYQFIQCDVPGIVPALNLGISNSKHDLVARFDADDVMRPIRIERQAKMFVRRPKLIALGGQIQFINSLGEPVDGGHYHLSNFMIARTLGFTNPIAHPASMFRRSIFDSIGGYRSGVPEDWDLWIRLSEHGKLRNLPYVLIDYRQSEKQISRTHLYTDDEPRDLMFKSAIMRRNGLDSDLDLVDREFSQRFGDLADDKNSLRRSISKPNPANIGTPLSDSRSVISSILRTLRFTVLRPAIYRLITRGEILIVRIIKNLQTHSCQSSGG